MKNLMHCLLLWVFLVALTACDQPKEDNETYKADLKLICMMGDDPVYKKTPPAKRQVLLQQTMQKVKNKKVIALLTEMKEAPPTARTDKIIAEAKRMGLESCPTFEPLKIEPLKINP